jgi:hypothetical protein
MTMVPDRSADASVMAIDQLPSFSGYGPEYLGWERYATASRYRETHPGMALDEIGRVWLFRHDHMPSLDGPNRIVNKDTVFYGVELPAETLVSLSFAALMDRVDTEAAGEPVLNYRTSAFRGLRSFPLHVKRRS